LRGNRLCSFDERWLACLSRVADWLSGCGDRNSIVPRARAIPISRGLCAVASGLTWLIASGGMRDGCATPKTLPTPCGDGISQALRAALRICADPPRRCRGLVTPRPHDVDTRLSAAEPLTAHRRCFHSLGVLCERSSWPSWFQLLDIPGGHQRGGQIAPWRRSNLIFGKSDFPSDPGTSRRYSCSRAFTDGQGERQGARVGISQARPKRHATPRR
jgi:hypothetical protein